MTNESPIERMVRAAPGRHGAAPSLLAVGDNVVDRYVEAGYMYPGGNAVNVAVHARRNGATSAYLGAVGTDRAGQVVLAALRRRASTRRCTRRSTGPTRTPTCGSSTATASSAAPTSGSPGSHWAGTT